MARNPRYDEPGRWHHVMNRGIARRTLFETEDDIRFFLSRVARAVRRQQLEVHAWCVMTTHFHLLVRSPRGELSRALRDIQNDYVRRFNRTRRRDGPLVRGRFGSKPVTSLAYRRTLVRYIDSNPVSARLVSCSHLYPHGSARHYLRATGPKWLTRNWVESCVNAANRPGIYAPSCYPHVFGGDLAPAELRLVEARMDAAAGVEDPLDELLNAAPAAVRSWMVRKARLADGTRPGMPLVDASSVDHWIERERWAESPWPIQTQRKCIDGWPMVHVGLLRDLCGVTFAEAARRSSRADQSAWSDYRRHLELMSTNESYARRVSALATTILSACHGRAAAAQGAADARRRDRPIDVSRRAGRGTLDSAIGG